jgi:hypothetical protein
MSTVPHRPANSRLKKIKDPAGSGEASFEYGWRMVRRKGQNGKPEWKRIPLTLQDVLHPQFGDVHVLSDPHTEDCTYLRTVLKERYADDRSVAILNDCGKTTSASDANSIAGMQQTDSRTMPYLSAEFGASSGRRRNPETRRF